jgi:hypothetical protein
MELFFRITLIVSAVINLIPFILVFFPDKIGKSYGIELPNINYELLMRHRAMLFGIVGGFLLFSGITRNYYLAATAIGLISMISFMILYWTIDGEFAPELKKVYLVDCFASILLFFGFVAYYFK